MTDKVLIKQEIEKQIDYAEDDTRYTESYREGLIAAYQTIKAFINSLSEEHDEGLEEEMIRWHKQHFNGKRDWEKTSGEYLTRKSQLDLARHFAEWQKQQMIKDAAKTTIVNDWQYGKDPDHAIIPAIHQRIDGFNVGDKVKIIIVKENK